MDSLYNIQGRKYLLTSNGLNKLKELYKAGNSQIKIANIFNVSEDTIRKWMKENNISIRNRKYKIDEKYFLNLDTPEKAYWIGFLSADGYVTDLRGEIQLELQKSDREHLIKFEKAISCNAPIKEIYCGEHKEFLHYRFYIRCINMVRTLNYYGITQNKSLNFYPRNIPKELIKYWILGYIDGDGCIFQAKNRIKISFTGTEKTLNFIKKYFKSNNIITLEHRCNNTYRFTLEVNISEKFLKDIRYNELPFVLKRKQMRYCSFIQ